MRATVGGSLLAVALLLTACSSSDASGPGADVIATTTTLARASVAVSVPDTVAFSGSDEVTTRSLDLVDGSRPTITSTGTYVAATRSLPTTVWVPAGSGPFPMVVFAHGYRRRRPLRALRPRPGGARLPRRRAVVPPHRRGPRRRQPRRGRHRPRGRRRLLRAHRAPGRSRARAGDRCQPHRRRGPLRRRVRRAAGRLRPHRRGHPREGRRGLDRGLTGTGPAARPADAARAVRRRQVQRHLLGHRASLDQITTPWWFLELHGATHAGPVEGDGTYTALLDATVLAFLDRHLAGSIDDDDAIAAPADANPDLATFTSG